MIRNQEMQLSFGLIQVEMQRVTFRHLMAAIEYQILLGMGLFPAAGM